MKIKGEKIPTPDPWIGRWVAFYRNDGEQGYRGQVIGRVLYTKPPDVLGRFLFTDAGTCYEENVLEWR